MISRLDVSLLWFNAKLNFVILVTVIGTLNQPVERTLEVIY